jgi:hypothetical protein
MTLRPSCFAAFRAQCYVNPESSQASAMPPPGVTWLTMAHVRTELINTVRYVGIHYLGQGWANG